MKCLKCNSKLKGKYTKKFCNRSCATSYNNSLFPKRKPENKCATCSSLINSRRKYCSLECKPQGQDMTLKEAIYVKHHKSSAFALVRARARALSKRWEMISCEECNYSTHVEIAHLKSISEFSEDTLLSKINARENLRALCPNHHWELDHPKQKEIKS